MDQAINTPLITEQVRDKPGSLRLTSGNLLDTHRYRDGDRSWAGRGKTPAWLLQLEGEGKSREQFRVGGGNELGNG